MNIDFLMTSALEQIASEGPRGAGTPVIRQMNYLIPFPAACCLLGNFHLLSLTREPIVNVSAKRSDLSVRLSCLITALKGQSRLMESTSGIGRETVFCRG